MEMNLDLITILQPISVGYNFFSNIALDLEDIINKIFSLRVQGT